MWERMKKSIAANVIFLLLAVLLGYSALAMLQGMFKLKGELDIANQKLAVLSQKNKELELRLTELDTKEAVEREAKARLNLKNIGESVVVLVPQKETAPLKNSANLTSLWERLKSILSF